MGAVCSSNVAGDATQPEPEGRRIERHEKDSSDLTRSPDDEEHSAIAGGFQQSRQNGAEKAKPKPKASSSPPLQPVRTNWDHGNSSRTHSDPPTSEPVAPPISEITSEKKPTEKSKDDSAIPPDLPSLHPRSSSAHTTPVQQHPPRRRYSLAAAPSAARLSTLIKSGAITPNSLPTNLIQPSEAPPVSSPSHPGPDRKPEEKIETGKLIEASEPELPKDVQDSEEPGQAVTSEYVESAKAECESGNVLRGMGISLVTSQGPSPAPSPSLPPKQPSPRTILRPTTRCRSCTVSHPPTSSAPCLPTSTSFDQFPHAVSWKDSGQLEPSNSAISADLSTLSIDNSNNQLPEGMDLLSPRSATFGSSLRKAVRSSSKRKLTPRHSYSPNGTEIIIPNELPPREIVLSRHTSKSYLVDSDSSSSVSVS